MIYYIIKGISPLKLSISTYIFEENEVKDKYPNLNTFNPFITGDYKNKPTKKRNLESKSVKQNSKKARPKNIFSGSNNDFLYPPKKPRVKNKERIGSAEKRKDTENMRLADIINKKKKFGKMQKYHNIRNKKMVKVKETKKVDFDVESLKSDKVRKRKSIIDYQQEREVRARKEEAKEKEKILLVLQSNKNLLNSIKDDDKDKATNNEIKSSFKIKDYEKVKEKDNKSLDDYELNHLEHKEALEKDKRGFWKTYWSLIKRDELLLFIIFSNDYNLFYVKIERFLFLILNIMAMNGFIFADMTIHKFYINGVKYNFSQQILQITLAIIITHFIEIVLCFLSLTDRYIYEIKAWSTSERTGENIFRTVKKMKIRLVAFFVTIFFVSLFYWYFISAFCAVYNNTQGMYLIDCVISFVIFLVDPFIIYAIVALLRIISINSISCKKMKCLYTISRLFPIF